MIRDSAAASMLQYAGAGCHPEPAEGHPEPAEGLTAPYNKDSSDGHASFDWPRPSSAQDDNGLIGNNAVN